MRLDSGNTGSVGSDAVGIDAIGFAVLRPRTVGLGTVEIGSIWIGGAETCGTSTAPDAGSTGVEGAGWGRRPADPNQTMPATAPNDSQNPAAIGAHGSSTQTTAAAVASTPGSAAARPDSFAAPATASIQQVRCAGIPQPANAE